VKRLAAPKVAAGAVVVVIKCKISTQGCCVNAFLSIFILVFVSFFALNIHAAVLPQESVEVLYHEYSGDNVTVSGPSVLVRKNIKDKVSVWGNYYVDNVTSASVDVVTQGSAYTEQRKQNSVGFDVLNDRSTFSLSYTRSIESDYDATSVSIGVSQDFFGDLTTLSLGYTYGDDIVTRNSDSAAQNSFSDVANRNRFNVALTQILTKNWVVSLNSETVIDDGFLNNPYRSIRFLRADGTEGSEPENYPRTRNSDALALRSMYYLPYRAAIRFEHRAYTDSWGIEGDNTEVRYIHPYNDKWVFEGRVRAASQGQASFYSDLFLTPAAEGDFRARDKELSQFSSILLGFGVTYEFKSRYLSRLDKTTVNFFYDRMQFKYDNFRDARQSRSINGEPPSSATGQEDLFQLDANVFRVFLSAWY